AVPFDGDLARAVAKLKLQSIWQALGPRGRMSFTARLSHVDAPPPPNMPKPPGELEVVFDRLHADGMVADFMPYELNDVSLSFRFNSRNHRDKVIVSNFQGSHGSSSVLIRSAEIFPKPSGGMWGEFIDVQFTPLIPDEELRAALPFGLRSTVASLEPSGTMKIVAGRVVVDVPPPEPDRLRPVSGRRDPRPIAAPEAASPWIYWENVVLTLSGASLKLGVKFETIFGEVGSRGEYRNGRLGAVEGN